MEFEMILWAIFLFIFLFLLLKNWNNIRFSRNGVPLGTLGLPFIGETIQFLQQGPDFMAKHISMYGEMFKTHILGGPTVVSNDADVNRYILMNESKGLVPGYPKSNRDVMGKYNIAVMYGSDHKLFRGSLLSLVGPLCIKQHLLPKIDKYIKLFLHDFHGRVVDIQQETLGMAFFVTFYQVVDSESDSFRIAFKKQFDKMANGSISLPIYIPGTSYYKALKARKNAIKMMREMVERRRGCKEIYNDLLDQLLGKIETKYELSDDQIFDQIITILNSGYETLSKTSMMCIKYLHDHPNVLQQLRDEHFKIREGKTSEDPITWDDYKSMKFTRAVILETLRLSTVVNGVLRQTTQDLVLNGLLIPKAWRIYVYIRELNYDPIVYPNPFSFNPWRWLEDKNLESHKNFLAFGRGVRLCPGKEWGIVKISIFLHHFGTQYRWEEIQEAKIRKFPRVEAINGLHVRVTKY